jgi:hypothetical protein
MQQRHRGHAVCSIGEYLIILRLVIGCSERMVVSLLARHGWGARIGHDPSEKTAFVTIQSGQAETCPSRDGV